MFSVILKILIVIYGDQKLVTKKLHLSYFTLNGNNSNATVSDECLMSNYLW